jgi:PKD repeat protein
MKKHLITGLLTVALLHAAAQTNLTHYQYWFDADYANASQQSITATPQFNLNTNISTANLSNGAHIFYIRFRDDAGQWSSPLSQFFYKVPQSSGSTVLLTGYEYWFDSDYANKVTQTTSAAQSIDVVSNIATSNLSNGAHIFYIRFRDNTGQWSSPLSQFFYKVPQSAGSTVLLTGYEYWFDSDYANKVTQTTSATQGINVVSNIATANLSNGAHIFYIRFRDNTGQWSSPLSQFFYKPAQTPGGINNVMAYRYWFDGDTALMQHVQLANPVPQLLLTDSLNMRHLWKGTHTVSLQFLDSRGQWSTIITDTVIKQSVPIAAFDVAIQGGCDSTVVTFTSQSIDADTYSWNFGNGQTSTLANPQVNYAQQGSYTVSLTVTDTALGISHTKTDTLHISSGISFGNLMASACGSYTSPSGNYTFTQSGQYVDTLVNQWGCDSILAISLTINPAEDSTWVVSSCGAYIAPWGNTYTQSGAYTHILQTVWGCDSTINLALTVNNEYDSTWVVDACRRFQSPWGTLYTQSGQYTVNLQTAQGCDSLIYLNLSLTFIDTAITVTPTTLTAVQNGASYQWVECDATGLKPIPNATNQTYVATQNGDYAVIITYNGCIDTSQCKTISQISIAEWDENNFVLYPNPASNVVQIDFNSLQKEVVLEIVAINGRRVHIEHFRDIQNLQSTFNLPDGVYMVTVYTHAETRQIKLIVRN